MAIFTKTASVNPGKLKKWLLFSVLAVVSALLWYANSRWRVCDHDRPLKQYELSEKIPHFPVDREVCLELAHARMLLLSGIHWKISVRSGKNDYLIFSGTRNDLSCKKIALPAPRSDGNYYLRVEGIDRAAKKVYTWSSDRRQNLRPSGTNYIRLIYAGDPQENATLEVSH